MSEKKQPVDLGLLEEDDEFEEFPAEGAERVGDGRSGGGASSGGRPRPGPGRWLRRGRSVWPPVGGREGAAGPERRVSAGPCPQAARRVLAARWRVPAGTASATRSRCSVPRGFLAARPGRGAGLQPLGACAGRCGCHGAGVTVKCCVMARWSGGRAPGKLGASLRPG